jgi:hypothetical protein
VWSEDAWLQKYALKSADPNVPYESDENEEDKLQQEEKSNVTQMKSPEQ